ncbi:hypothetical protein A3L09_06335 [Thermococcus profundus]|uniref:Uncharacterized protein n=1 Tax=Thermococcus profundus TaxID=49899 RepID=A0A2Z2MBM3_THEPR|nr:FAD-dependent oxidoreductase [Thermococcus profundus]ASJ02903.1 hypothetical protein A3L09_06335 [Thermococcus profundus]
MGGGFIALELAGNIAKAGYRVRLVHRGGSLLRLDDKLTGILREKLEESGVEFYLNTNVLSADEKGLDTDKGHIADALKVCTFRIVPNKELAVRSGIHAGRGILIDERFRTSAKDVYAIGDCAEYGGTICGTAKCATGHAGVLANLLVGKEDSYDFTFRSALFKFGDLPLAIIGKTRGEGRWLDEGVKVFTDEERVVGAVVIGNPRRAFEIEKRIREGVEPTDL